MTVNINELMSSSGVQFGTSGVRGLVNDMTDQICFTYITAFLQYLLAKQLIKKGSKVGIAGDLRFSTPRIMNAAAAACIELGFEPVNYGFIPSPAIALYGLNQQIATIMVTGSHIPDDRNGIKFNTPLGEILKPDEEGIRSQQVNTPVELFNSDGMLNRDDYLPDKQQDAEHHYIQRFVDFLPDNCLQGKKIGLYEHSSVSRDCINIILQQLGADVTSLGRSDKFVSVDTEAIRTEDISLAKKWAEEYEFDCIISTDGDGDRPLISDESGNWLRGDVAGVLCAQYLNADIVITPVSSNSAVEKSGLFNNVIRTKIGSPYVIEAMQQADNDCKVVGYEANGGFLQQTPITQGNNTLSPLPTRDAVIVPLTIMLLAIKEQITISQLLKSLPERCTYSDRIKDFPTRLSQQLLGKITTGDVKMGLKAFRSYFPNLNPPVSIDDLDGVRITLDNDEIVHLRPSGNAPELRCYTEADSEKNAEALNRQCIVIMNQWN